MIKTNHTYLKIKQNLINLGLKAIELSEEEYNVRETFENIKDIAIPKQAWIKSFKIVFCALKKSFFRDKLVFLYFISPSSLPPKIPIKIQVVAIGIFPIWFITIIITAKVKFIIVVAFIFVISVFSWTFT